VSSPRVLPVSFGYTQPDVRQSSYSPLRLGSSGPLLVPSGQGLKPRSTGELCRCVRGGCPAFRGTSVAARCSSGHADQVIMVGGSDSFGGLAFEGGAQAREV